MKKLITGIALFTALLSFSSTKAQFTFSVSPGLQLNSANFGYRINKFVPFIGLQVLSVGTKVTETGLRSGSSSIESYSDEFKFSGNAYMPFIGTKYFFKEADKLKMYGSLMLAKPILRGKVENSTDPNANKDVEDFIKNTSIWAGQAGFGMEYFFDDNFSIGGEFGLLLAHAKNKQEQQTTVFNPGGGPPQDATITTKTNVNIRPTYTKFSLNYYLNR